MISKDLLSKMKECSIEKRSLAEVMIMIHVLYIVYKHVGTCTMYLCTCARIL